MYASVFLLSLGSNTEPAKLSQAVAQLNLLGQTTISKPITGKDFTGKSERLYHNACVLLTVNQAEKLPAMLATFKQIEQLCGRQVTPNNDQVAMDIDILAYQIDGHWQFNPKKLPLKTHDRLGVGEIAAFLLDDLA